MKTQIRASHGFVGFCPRRALYRVQMYTAEDCGDDGGAIPPPLIKPSPQEEHQAGTPH